MRAIGRGMTATPGGMALSCRARRQEQTWLLIFIDSLLYHWLTPATHGISAPKKIVTATFLAL